MCVYIEGMYSSIASLEDAKIKGSHTENPTIKALRELENRGVIV